MTGNLLDAVVVGAGPNGLAAAIAMARAGHTVLVLEEKDHPGGGVHSAELTIPGVFHDVGSSVYPLAAGSPFFRSLPLDEHGLSWVHSRFALAHPFVDGSAAVLCQDMDAMVAAAGADGERYRRVVGAHTRRWEAVAEGILGLRPGGHLGALARFSLDAALPATVFARRAFRDRRLRALWLGIAAHSGLPLTRVASNGFALVLATAGHRFGWPVARGGARTLQAALVRCLETFGGRIRLGHPVRRMSDIPAARCMLFDVSPADLAGIAKDRLPARYLDRLRGHRYGPAVFKVDWALSQPVPWAAPQAREAITVHVGGDVGEVVASEAGWGRRAPETGCFLIVTQPSIADPDRTPQGRHVAWGYCHVPAGDRRDHTAAIEAQIERFAPGFRDCIVARHRFGPRALELYDRNFVAGDINGGSPNLMQLARRPVLSPNPYATPAPGLFLCSAGTPPGGGVHGMCGHNAARAAIEYLRRRARG